MVRTGESLPAIAEEHHMTVERLRRLNPGVDRVFPGQKLILQREQADHRPVLGLGRKTAVTLPLLTPEERSGRQYEKLEFEKTAAQADFVLLPTPEGHRPAPLPRLRARLKAALQLIPREKIILLLDGQGRDGRDMFSRQEAEALAAENNAAIRFDPAAGLAHFRYSDSQGREHRVKFPDLRTLSAELELIAEAGISGVSLPSPGPADLLLLESRFRLEEYPE